MSLTIVSVPDTRFYLGPGLQGKVIQCTPAASDYVRGGYTITTEQADFGNGNVFGAMVLNQEYSASTASPVYQVNMPVTSYGTNPQPSTTSFKVTVWGTSGTAGTPLEEVAAGTDLSGNPFQLLVLGY